MTPLELAKNPILRGLAEESPIVKAAFELHFSGMYSAEEAFTSALVAVWHRGAMLEAEKQELERLAGIAPDPLVPPTLDEAYATVRAYHRLRAEVSQGFLQALEKLAWPEPDATVWVPDEEEGD